jgi:hypothetical protein
MVSKRSMMATTGVRAGSSWLLSGRVCGPVGSVVADLVCLCSLEAPVWCRSTGCRDGWVTTSRGEAVQRGVG